MKRNYHTIDDRGKVNERRLTEFLTKNGQQLLPFLFDAFLPDFDSSCRRGKRAEQQSVHQPRADARTHRATPAGPPAIPGPVDGGAASRA